MKKKSWHRPSETSIRKLAGELGIPGHKTMSVDWLYEAINTRLYLVAMGKK